MRIFIFSMFFITASACAEDGCLVVRGYDLCEDARIIARNTEKEIGLKHKGHEYTLESVYSEKMRVISTHQSIYTEAEAIDLVKQKIELSQDTKQTIQDWLDSINDRSTKQLCQIYSQDEFVNDGGSFEVIYRYKDGKIFHRVLAEKGNCRAI